MSETITAYKAFNADLTCRGFQYEIGATYTHKGKVAACSGGFHACENPLDVWGYYPIVDGKGALTRYAEVELSGAMDKDGDKIAAAQITIKAEIRMPDFIKRAVAWVIDATKVMGDDPSGDYTQIGSSGYSAKIGSSGNYAKIGSSGDYTQIGSSGYSAKIGSSGDYAKIGSSGYYAKIGSSGNYAKIGSSGDYTQIGSSGDYTQIGSSGNYAKIGSSGDYTQIGSSGDYTQIGSSGNYAKIGSSGDYTQIGSSGNYAKIGSSGYYAKIGSSGNYAQINVSGSGSVVASAGYDTVVTAVAGTWLSLAEYDDEGHCIGFGTGKVEKDGVYRAEGGKLVEVVQ